MQQSEGLFGKLKDRVNTKKVNQVSVTVKIETGPHAKMTSIFKRLGRGAGWQALVEEAVKIVIDSNDKPTRKLRVRQ